VLFLEFQLRAVAVAIDHDDVAREEVARQQPERQRILYQALTVGFGVTFAATLVYSVLEDLGLPHVSAVWWWGTLALSWVVGLAISSRRYR